MVICWLFLQLERVFRTVPPAESKYQGCVHNYRCTVPPKHSLEKGMGMTPGYNHRWRLRNKPFLLDPV